MKPCSGKMAKLRSRPRFRQMAGTALLGAFLVAGLLVTAGCGRTPPEALWEPTAEDTSAIMAWVEQNRALFSAGFSDDSLMACDTVLPGTTATRLRSEIAENRFKQRFRYDALQRVLYEDGYRFKPSFIATIDTTIVVAGEETTWVYDTTATVTMVESIPGELRLRAFSYTKYLRDTLFFPSPGETLRLRFYDNEFSPIDQVVVKTFEGASNSGAVLKKEGGRWEPWKYAGGYRFYAPNPNDAPYVVYMDVVGKDTTVRVFLRPDTLNYGIQRFYSSDELPTFRVGDSISIRQTGVLSTIGDAAGYIYFRGERYEFLTPRSAPVHLTEPGVFTFFATQTPISVMYEVEGDRLEMKPEESGAYIGTVWGIKIRVVDEPDE